MPNLNTGTVQAGILISSFVAGLIPVLAALFLASKVPKPGTTTLLPALSSLPTAQTKASKARPASFIKKIGLFRTFFDFLKLKMPIYG